MSCVGIWFWHELFPNHTYSRLCGFSYWFCFGVSWKPRGSFAEAPRKEHMPKQRYSPPMPWQSPSPRRTHVANEKGQKWKQMQAHKAKMKDYVVALWSRKQELRKQGRGSSRKGYMWNVCRGSWRCGRGSIAEAVAEAVNNFLSTTKEKKTKLMWFHFLGWFHLGFFLGSSAATFAE